MRKSMEKDEEQKWKSNRGVEEKSLELIGAAVHPSNFEEKWGKKNQKRIGGTRGLQKGRREHRNLPQQQFREIQVMPPCVALWNRT
nr:ras-related protein Rab-9B isoform X2 [Saimiri boliviensis boliviensis]